ncbi:hypothetical protein [Hoeflea sp. 108]|jgi:hypothetical protein|uniref:hypothetical protein n=1 Tax=Hoeflea sp. 108 TaxID=1116369 RepID=UPI000369FFA1|nr:hypothetical protein [Hoeflea sp. 108]
MTREFYGATIQAQRAINGLLNLPASGREQDWEIELADPDRVEEMLEAAVDSNLDYDERCALALLTIASIEELFELGEVSPAIVEQARSTIRQYHDVHEAMVFYWIEQRQASNEENVREVLFG